ncbi:MAG: iron-containing alcohol dehydrogenase [Roseinatronobacter sp.]
MTPFAFATASQIRFGRGGISELPAYAKGRAQRILLVRSASVAQADDLARALQAFSAVQELFVRGEPDLSRIEADVAHLQPFAPQLVIAIGGGAVIDHAKALAALIPAPHCAMRYLEVVGEGRSLDQIPLPVVAVPTTAGTGTEVTRNAVIQIPEARRKVSLRDPGLYPALALVDPDLCQSCPKSVTLASGLDAITQVIEPFICNRANPITDALCRDAIPRGLSALRRLLDASEMQAWEDMALTSVYGGIALANAGLGAVHGFASVIGGQTGAAHGAICGTLLVPVLKANAQAALAGSEAQNRIRWVCEQITDEFGSVEDFQNWARAQGLPRLAAYGISADKHADLAREAVLSSSYKANPADLSQERLVQILAEG